MAVTLLKHYERFAGLSTDVKPANAPMGSTFFEWDTSKLYTLSPAGWVEKKGTIHGDVQLSGSKASEYEAIIVDNTVGGKAFTAAKYAGCTKAFVTVETAQIRFTIDGTAPTTTVGHLLNIGDILELDSAEDIAAFRAIRTGATSGVIHCTYSA